METEEITRDHTSGVIYLESLGYIIHPEKTVTVPSQNIEFLGRAVDSNVMQLHLPGQSYDWRLQRSGINQPNPQQPAKCHAYWESSIQ